MKITINCPACKIGFDVELREEPDPIFEDFYLDAYKECPHCEIDIHIALTGRNKTTVEVPF